MSCMVSYLSFSLYRVQLPPGSNLRNVSPARRVAGVHGRAVPLNL